MLTWETIRNAEQVLRRDNVAPPYVLRASRDDIEKFVSTLSWNKRRSLARLAKRMRPEWLILGRGEVYFGVWSETHIVSIPPNP